MPVQHMDVNRDCTYLFKQGVTVLIHKSDDSKAPNQFRPITMGTILCRLFHKILAARIESGYRISDRQKAFRKGDGIADNTHILRYVLSDRLILHSWMSPRHSILYRTTRYFLRQLLQEYLCHSWGISNPYMMGPEPV